MKEGVQGKRMPREQEDKGKNQNKKFKKNCACAEIKGNSLHGDTDSSSLRPPCLAGHCLGVAQRVQGYRTCFSIIFTLQKVAILKNIHFYFQRHIIVQLGLGYLAEEKRKERHD